MYRMSISECHQLDTVEWFEVDTIILSSGLDDIRLTITNFESFSNYFRFKAGVFAFKANSESEIRY